VALSASNATVRQIVESLGETAPAPLNQIRQIVAALGEMESLAVLARTERVEQAGGILVANGTRRRTPGGVFFQLVRKELTRKLRGLIFPGDRARAEKRRRPASPKLMTHDATMAQRGVPRPGDGGFRSDVICREHEPNTVSATEAFSLRELRGFVTIDPA
jgi:hypothetical protein